MASYLITGASRGLGFEFVRQLAQDPGNVVIGLVRNKKSTEEKIHRELKQHANVHIVQADLEDYVSIQNSVPDVSNITGGSLDYIIANAAIVSSYSAFDSLGTLGKDPAGLEKDLLESFKVNVVGNIHLFNSYMPLILKGNVKKVITLSTGMADLDLVNKFELAIAAPYAISKVGVNAAVAKYNAEYGKDGVLFLAISPGLVDTGNNVNVPEEHAAGFAEMTRKFALYAPHFKGPATAEESVNDMLTVINKATVETYGGAFVSHKGNKEWL
ncbi:hypothetical protein B0T10DRAFT_552471 [Thelonectria olida]|uniref:Uncharacterized protein n=1 Tax=Thelonectria olida TaxID=1576542 RepID=A0A9P9AK10_9HYPO|nr:hypothetical protein B0T10DRAFT_552471 [Thelonectria olida]